MALSWRNEFEELSVVEAIALGLLEPDLEACHKSRETEPPEVLDELRIHRGHLLSLP
jgi:hypothetical protein